MTQLFMKMCMNRPRLRRTLCHVLIDWDRFQAEAENTDTDLRRFTHEPPHPDDDGGPAYSYPLSSWAFHLKLRIMESIVLLGFELEIYQPYEYAGMYWQVSTYLRTRINHIERIRTHILPRPSHDANPRFWKENMAASKQYLTYLELEATAMNDLARGS